MFSRRLLTSARQLRRLSTSTGAGRSRSAALVAAGAAAAAGLAVAVSTDWRSSLPSQLGSFASVASAATDSAQPSVYSDGKDHALYLTIHVNQRADRRAVAKAVASLQRIVDEVSPPDMRDEEDEVWAGVGFGYSFYKSIASSPKPIDFSYPNRSGPLGDMPATGGDIFVHAKSNEISKLYELCRAVVSAMPSGSVSSFADVYSFVYRNGRDLSGFIDGTENPADEDSRRQVAVESGGGSYVITQRWVHLHDRIRRAKDSDLESYVGRTLPDSTELRRKAVTSHVARMTGGAGFQQQKKFEIVRQSMPYGSVSGESGLFFIAYAASPDNFNWMLDRMTAKGEDKLADDVMRISKCVEGNYWYFPSVSELARLA